MIKGRMGKNSPNISIILFGRVGAIWASAWWVMQLIIRWFGGDFVWSICGGVRSSKGGDRLEPWPWDKVRWHPPVLNFLKNIRGAATMAAAPLIMRLVVRRRGRTFGWSLWTQRLSLGGLLGDENWGRIAVLERSSRAVIHRRWILAGLWRPRDERKHDLPVLRHCLGG